MTIEKRNASLGIKTRWRFCDLCNTMWTFDHLNDKCPVAHKELPLRTINNEPELCPDCEAMILANSGDD